MFPFPLATAFWIGIVTTTRRSAANFFTFLKIGADLFISWIGVAERICRMIIRLTYHRLIKKLIISANTIGAVIWNYIWQEHFDPASPIRPDNAYSKSCSKRKRKYWVLQRKCTFKFKITHDRHNAIQSLNYYDLPDPRHFSLPSTFKYCTNCEVPQ